MEKGKARSSQKAGDILVAGLRGKYAMGNGQSTNTPHLVNVTLLKLLIAYCLLPVACCLLSIICSASLPSYKQNTLCRLYKISGRRILYNIISLRCADQEQ